MPLRTIVYFWFIPLLVCYQVSSSFALTDSTTSHPTDFGSVHDTGYVFTFMYLNDDFLFEKNFNRAVNSQFFPAADDHVTAEFAFSATQVRHRDFRAVDLFLVLLTSRSENFRTDLLGVRWMDQTAYKGVTMVGGIGVVVNGNLGGDKLQNAYHATFGFRPVELEYSSAMRLGLWINSEVDVPIATTPHSGCLIRIAPSLVTNGAPSSFELSTRLTLTGESTRLVCYGGYVERTTIPDDLRSILGSGLTWGIQYNFTLSESALLGLSFSKNQFGLVDDPHFGFTITFGSLAKLDVLRDLRFP